MGPKLGTVPRDGPKLSTKTRSAPECLERLRKVSCLIQRLLDSRPIRSSSRQAHFLFQFSLLLV